MLEDTVQYDKLLFHLRSRNNSDKDQVANVPQPKVKMKVGNVISLFSSDYLGAFLFINTYIISESIVRASESFRK